MARNQGLIKRDTLEEANLEHFSNIELCVLNLEAQDFERKQT